MSEDHSNVSLLKRFDPGNLADAADSVDRRIGAQAVNHVVDKGPDLG